VLQISGELIALLLLDDVLYLKYEITEQLTEIERENGAIEHMHVTVQLLKIGRFRATTVRRSG
jgi:hypothetical protein